ncbi:MAG: hypothetical protein K6F63_00275 [Lachnospiraceae bacterium]|nr:hypothetical protein [Lachnospiraceae bacterium]
MCEWLALGSQVNDWFALGLLDYLNPICYTAFTIIGFFYFRKIMKPGFFYVYFVGAIISLIGGFFIPTIKTLIGLGVMEWGLPVSKVIIANTGFLISGPTLFIGTLKANRVNASKDKNVTLNSVGILGANLAFLNKFIVGFGALGMIMIYVTCAKLAIERKRYYAVVTLVLALCGTLFNSVYSNAGTNLDSPEVHLIIEVFAVITNFMLVVSAYLLFIYKGKKKEEA